MARFVPNLTHLCPLFTPMQFILEDFHYQKRKRMQFARPYQLDLLLTSISEDLESTVEISELLLLTPASKDAEDDSF